MKKVFRKLLAVLLSSTVALSFAGCAAPEVEEQEEPLEQIDASKTQLYINNYGGGYSSAWLRAAKERFEDLHKDDEWEEGKKGVQIYVTSPKSAVTSAGIRNNRDEVYFSEYAYYRSLKSDGVLLDITDAVKADLKDYGDEAGKTIESKMTAQQQEFFGITENGSAHYYGLPHYAGYTGITYNVDLFDEKGYYFVDGYETKTKKFLFYYNNAEKSVGPDGVKGTSDDGLPETYDDFFVLLQQMQSDGVVPISWNGTHNATYLNYLLQSLVADYEGLDQMMLNYTFDGNATDLGTIQGGEFVKDATPTKIEATNGYEVYRQQGKYEALEFLRKLVVKSNDDYHHELAFAHGCAEGLSVCGYRRRDCADWHARRRYLVAERGDRNVQHHVEAVRRGIFEREPQFRIYAIAQGDARKGKHKQNQRQGREKAYPLRSHLFDVFY